MHETNQAAAVTMRISIVNAATTASSSSNNKMRMEIDATPHRSVKDLLKKYEVKADKPMAKNANVPTKRANAAFQKTAWQQADLKTKPASSIDCELPLPTESVLKTAAFDSPEPKKATLLNTITSTAPASSEPLKDYSMNSPATCSTVELSPDSTAASDSDFVNIPTPPVDEQDHAATMASSNVTKTTKLPSNPSVKLLRHKPTTARVRIVSDKIKLLSLPFTVNAQHAASSSLLVPKPIATRRTDIFEETAAISTRTMTAEEKAECEQVILPCLTPTRSSRLYKFPTKSSFDAASDGSPSAVQETTTTAESILKELLRLDAGNAQLSMASTITNTTFSANDSPDRTMIHSNSSPPVMVEQRLSPQPNGLIQPLEACLSSTPDSRISERSKMHAVNLSPLFRASLKMSPRGEPECKQELSPPVSPPRLLRDSLQRQSNAFCQLSFNMDNHIYERIERDDGDDEGDDEDGDDDNDNYSLNVQPDQHEPRDEDENEHENEEGWSSDDSSGDGGSMEGTMVPVRDVANERAMVDATTIATGQVNDRFARKVNPNFSRWSRDDESKHDHEPDAACHNKQRHDYPVQESISAATFQQQYYQESDLYQHSPINRGQSSTAQVHQSAMTVSTLLTSSSRLRASYKNHEALSSESDEDDDDDDDDNVAEICRRGNLSDRALGDLLADSNSEGEASATKQSPPRPPPQFVANLCSSFDGGCMTPVNTDTISQEGDEHFVMQLAAPTIESSRRRHKAWFRRRPRILKKKSKAQAKHVLDDDVVSMHAEPVMYEYSCMSPESTAATEEEVETVLME